MRGSPGQLWTDGYMLEKREADLRLMGNRIPAWGTRDTQKKRLSLA